MTRHNLTSELAWLISNKVTPSSTVNARVRVAPQHEDLEIFGIQAEDLEAFEGEDIDLASSPIREPQGEFARPQPIRHPPRPSNAQAQVQSTPILPGPTVMSRHEGDGKGRAPGATTQYQLATPDSTTTSTAAPSSLAHSYTQMLRRENGGKHTNSPPTPSISDYRSGTLATQPQVERLQSRTARSNQTPQTPRKTPRPTIESHLRNVESVDLTEEFTIDTGEPRSSSTEVILHKGPTVWTPAAAARPEPLSRTSKKRKSDDIAGGSSRKRSAKSPQKHRLQEEDDGFMDIDDVVPSQSQASRSHERTEVVQRSVEVPGYDGNMELKETETISRTEKHTRKSISRVSSMNDPIPSNCEAGQMGKPLLPQPRIRHASSPSKSHSNIQVAASPMLNRSQPRVGSSPTPTPKLKHERVSSRKIVQDSDDDEEDLLADNTRVSCSPKRFIKASPKSSSIVGSPRPQYTVEYKPDFQVYRDEPPRTASPLRTISTNLVDRMKSPVPKNSPVRSSLAVTPSTTTREQTVNSSLSIDDKVLVTRYLTDPSLLSSYSERVQTLKAQSAMDCMAYTDRCEPAPSNLRHERMRILDMEKAYIELAVLRAKHQELKAEKKRLANQIARDLDADIDTSDAEERQAAITKIMRECERNVGINLHKSGAVEDGFGTEQTRDSILPISKSSLNFNGSAQQVAGSSAQIILQTQFPSLQQQCSAPQVIYGAMPSNASSHMQDRYEDMEIRCRESSSPVRRQTSADTRSHRAVTSTLSERQRQKAPVAQRQPTEDFDECYDEHFLQLIEEDEQRNDRLNLRTKPGEIEEDYGDDNDDDFLEIAERFESLPSRRTPNSNTALRAPSNTSQQKGKSQSKKDMYAHVDDRAGFQFPWSKEVKKALRERFKLTGFRENQLDAINATLAGEDAFVLMPTGGGKSLCYQLPAIVTSGKTRGVTVVISPLLSLMTDQVDHLMAKHIQAVTLNGEQPKDKRDKIFTALKDPHPDQYIQVLYVTPEMVGKSAQLMTALRGLHQRKRLARIVIDEAHCVSQWGHDFRPDYKTLVELRQKFPGVPYMALTATATQSVKADCIHNLGMENCKEFKQSFNRPNLKYEILPKKGKGSAAATLETMVKLIKETHKNQTGIVYTLSKKGCEDLARGFCENGISAHHFHAGMKPEDKAYVQTAWQTGRFQIVVATIAFGMGIDKPDVRFVIHHTIPKSLEGYYQETGRAGRDGKPSNCYLFYGYQDTAILRRFIEDGEGDRAVKESQRAMLKSMVRYCEDRDDCRRSNILAYFGESFNKEDCNNMCDNCASDAVYETKDMTVLARSAIKLVQQYDDDNLTLLYVVDFLRGANKKFKEHHKDLKCRGMAKDLQRGEVERLLTRLLMDDVLVEDNVVNGGGFVCAYLKVCIRCMATMSRPANTVQRQEKQQMISSIANGN